MFKEFFHEMPNAVANFELKIAKQHCKLRSILYHPLGKKVFEQFINESYSDNEVIIHSFKFWKLCCQFRNYTWKDALNKRIDDAKADLLSQLLHEQQWKNERDLEELISQLCAHYFTTTNTTTTNNDENDESKKSVTFEKSVTPKTKSVTKKTKTVTPKKTKIDDIFLNRTRMQLNVDSNLIINHHLTEVQINQIISQYPIQFHSHITRYFTHLSYQQNELLKIAKNEKYLSKLSLDVLKYNLHVAFRFFDYNNKKKYIFNI